jgi:putative ABC transport system ATP-binding protein
MNLLVGIVREDNGTVVLVTHDAHVAGYADREIMVRDGLVCADEEASRLCRASACG